MSSIQDAYERITYPSYVHPLADPARLSAIARMLGLSPANPTTARVLDVGCGSGANLLAMAERLPGGQFLGIDFAASAIAEGKWMQAQAGLDNVELLQADLLAWQPNGRQFDYIIAYGLFSWVPDEVKDRLLRLCRECLAPGGIACISYLTYPGCKQAEALRDLLRQRTADCGDLHDKAATARDVLGFLDRSFERLSHHAHASYLHDQVGKMLRKSPQYLLLDDLGEVRDPCYLLQFANWASEHQLRYVGESELHMMFLENLPPDSAKELAAMRLSHLETEQLIDYVVNRSFRCSLLVRQDAPQSAGLCATELRNLSFRPKLSPVNRPADGEREGLFQTDAGLQITLRSEPLVAFISALAARPGAFTPYSQAIELAQAAANRAFSDEEQSRLCEDLLSLIVRRQLDVSAIAFSPPAKLAERPRLTPLNRALAQKHAMLVTAFHEAIPMTPTEQAFCTLLDGEQTTSELCDAHDANALNLDRAPFLAKVRAAGCLEEASMRSIIAGV